MPGAPARRRSAAETRPARALWRRPSYCRAAGRKARSAGARRPRGRNPTNPAAATRLAGAAQVVRVLLHELVRVNVLDGLRRRRHGGGRREEKGKLESYRRKTGSAYVARRAARARGQKRCRSRLLEAQQPRRRVGIAMPPKEKARGSARTRALPSFAARRAQRGQPLHARGTRRCRSGCAASRDCAASVFHLFRGLTPRR